MTAALAEIARYLSEVDKLYRAGNATEHSYRPAGNLFSNAAYGNDTVKAGSFLYGGV
ncbi:MAG: hypothetical protein LBT00_13930 [Spirochaetaceae bacterium]|jgi:hypothetical protein|nr:hypothetical protein [Spirochaetaceae bacterium]